MTSSRKIASALALATAAFVSAPLLTSGSPARADARRRRSDGPNYGQQTNNTRRRVQERVGDFPEFRTTPRRTDPDFFASDFIVRF